MLWNEMLYKWNVNVTYLRYMLNYCIVNQVADVMLNCIDVTYYRKPTGTVENFFSFILFNFFSYFSVKLH